MKNRGDSIGRLWVPLLGLAVFVTSAACSTSPMGGAGATIGEGGAVPVGSRGLSHYVYFIHPSRPAMITEGMRDDEARLIGEHFAYLSDLRDDGVVLLAGPSTSPPYTGIVVFLAGDPAEAERVMRDDPAVRGGVFDARLAPFTPSLVGAWDRGG